MPSLLDIAANQIGNQIAGGASPLEAGYYGAQLRPLEFDVKKTQLQTQLQGLRTQQSLPAIMSKAGQIGDSAKRMDYLSKALLTIDPKLALDYSKEADTAKYRAGELVNQAAGRETARLNTLAKYVSDITDQSSLDAANAVAQGTPLEGVLPTVFTPEVGEQMRQRAAMLKGKNAQLEDMLTKARVGEVQAQTSAARSLAAERLAKKQETDIKASRLQNGLPESPGKGTENDPWTKAAAANLFKEPTQAQNAYVGRVLRAKLGLPAESDATDGETNALISEATDKVHRLTEKNLLDQIEARKETGKLPDKDLARRQALEQVAKEYTVTPGKPGGIFSRATPPGLQRKAQTVPAGIPDGAIKALRADPSLREQFDEKFGEGAADAVLGDGA